MPTLAVQSDSQDSDRGAHSFDHGRDTSNSELETTENSEPEARTNGESLRPMAPNPRSEVPSLMNPVDSPAMEMAPNTTSRMSMDMEEEAGEEAEVTEEGEQPETGPEGGLPDAPPEGGEENRPGDESVSADSLSTEMDSGTDRADIEQMPGQNGTTAEDSETSIDLGEMDLMEQEPEELSPQSPAPEEPEIAGDQSASGVSQPETATSGEGDQEPSTGSVPSSPEQAAGEGGGAEKPEKSTEKGLSTDSSSAMMRSLTSMSAIDFVEGIDQANKTAARLQEKEKKQEQESLPEIDQPTGLPTKAQKQAERTKLKKEKSPDLEPKEEDQEQQVDTEHKQGEGPAPAESVPRFRSPETSEEEDSGSWWSRLYSRIKSYVRSLPSRDNRVKTSAGKRPEVDLSGKADPNKNKEQKTKADKKVQKKKAEAQKETTKDFGEHNIYPDVETQKMSPSVQIEGKAPREEKSVKKRKLDPEVSSALNANLQSKMNEEVTPKNQEFAEARQKYETDSKKEKEEGLAKIDDKAARIKAEQEGQQATAKQQVEEEREKWRKENKNVKETYEKQSAKKKKEIDRKINDKVESAEKKADKKLSKAEEKAERKKKKAEEKARKKKKEAENKPKSFWERAKGAVSDFFDKVRSAINTIFEKLRKAVKVIIEAAKNAVKGIIELARKAVVGLIKALGEALKKFVSIALSAFPELAKKARTAIDKAVNKAVETVNKVAQALKNFAEKVLDSIGAALDFIISVYQKAYNAILDALEFIAIGLVEIMEGIANLAAAAKESPQYFWDAIFEELTGTDPSKPLAAIERTEQPDTQTQAEGLAETDEYSAQDESLLKKEKLNGSDINIEPVRQISLSPELEMQIAQSDADEIEFGGAGDDSISVQDLQTTTSPQSGGTNGGGPSSAAGGNAGEAPEFETMSDEEKLQYYLDQMDPSCEDTSKDAGGGGGGESIPDVAKVGPLSVSQRKEYILDQMKKGISNWWECNKVTVISVLVGALLGGTILTVVTGGGFLSALPVIMKALMVIFIAEMVYRMGSHLKDYLTKAWGGDISGGAKSLARAFAVGAVELIFEGIFRVGGKLLKLMKRAGKRLAKSMGRVAKKAAKTTVRTVKATGKAVKNVAVKGGRYTFNGLKKGIAKGARTLDDLNKQLLDRFKFRKFKIKRKGGRFQLLGYLNPWVLMANGDIEYAEGAKKNVLGKKMEVPDGRKGIVIGAQGSKRADASLITRYLQRNPEKAKEMSGLLNNLGDDALRAKAIEGITNYKYLRGRYEDALEVLTEAAKKNVKGLDKVLSDLAQGGNKAKGAGWVVRHLYKNKHLIKNLDEFEQFVKIGGERRFYDAVINGVKYEFKNWGKIRDIYREGLVKQMYRDLNSGYDFKWIWSGRVGSKTALKKEIKDIISDEKLMGKFGFDPQDIDLLKNNLTEFFKQMEVV